MAPTDGGPAFPLPLTSTTDGDILDTVDYAHANGGISLRDYFAIHAPEPSNERVRLIMQQEQAANPHNEPYHNKVRRRGEQEIRCALRYEFADAMLKAREANNA